MAELALLAPSRHYHHPDVLGPLEEDTAGEWWGENLDNKIDDAFLRTETARRISHDHNSQKNLLLPDESSW